MVCITGDTYSADSTSRDMIICLKTEDKTLFSAVTCSGIRDANTEVVGGAGDFQNKMRARRSLFYADFTGARRAWMIVSPDTLKVSILSTTSEEIYLLFLYLDRLKLGLSYIVESIYSA